MSLFWEYQQQSEINSAKGEAYAASGKAERAQNKIYELERKLVRQSLACQALWELVRERLNLTEDDFAERMLEIDLRDGVADGKMTQQIVQCPSCGRNANSTRENCFYCGGLLAKSHVFE